MVLLFVQLVDFAESVHVQLPDEGLDLFVAEIERQHLVFEGVGVFDLDLGRVRTPADDIFKFVPLRKLECYLENVVDLHYKLGHIGF